MNSTALVARLAAAAAGSTFVNAADGLVYSKNSDSSTTSSRWTNTAGRWSTSTQLARWGGELVEVEVDEPTMTERDAAAELTLAREAEVAAVAAQNEAYRAYQAARVATTTATDARHAAEALLGELVLMRRRAEREARSASRRAAADRAAALGAVVRAVIA